jgi:adenosylmethionine-8-amino-7-oxononanoate aminotransferase
VQIDREAVSADPRLAARVVTVARAHGVLSRALAPGALQVSPPLVLESDGLRGIVDGIAAALDEVEAER